MALMVLSRPGVPIGLAFWLAAALLWSWQPPRTSHTLAQAVPVPAATTNAYWAGYVAAGDGPYTSVEATWTVPAASCPATGTLAATAYEWIGEGGYLRGLASPLIQAGTGAACAGGGPTYHAFYEWYPGIDATDFPVEVHPGDVVTVRIEERQSDDWVLSFHDLRTDARSATAVFFQADTGSADFVVERPTVCGPSGCGQVALARFQPVTFRDIRLTEGSGRIDSGLPTATAIAL
ncbi:MAG: hypothetical protein JOZ41_13025, partial [Chloroflexi bacterium]|nr:hypothetical protein [Chloroflexota bacterium]